MKILTKKEYRDEMLILQLVSAKLLSIIANELVNPNHEPSKEDEDTANREVSELDEETFKCAMRIEVDI